MITQRSKNYAIALVEQYMSESKDEKGQVDIDMLFGLIEFQLAVHREFLVSRELDLEYEEFVTEQLASL